MKNHSTVYWILEGLFWAVLVVTLAWLLSQALEERKQSQISSSQYPSTSMEENSAIRIITKPDSQYVMHW